MARLSRATDDELDYDIQPLWHVDGLEPGDKGFVDVLNDVTVSDVHLAIREGYGAVEHVKRYTTGGMAMDQGKTGNVNIIGAIAQQQRLALDDVGATTFRAPYSPVEFGAIGGVREGSVVLPYRHTPPDTMEHRSGLFHVRGWCALAAARLLPAGGREFSGDGQPRITMRAQRGRRL